LFFKSSKQRCWMLECIEAIEEGALQAWADKKALDDDAKSAKDKQAANIKPLSPDQRQQIKDRRARRC